MHLVPAAAARWPETGHAIGIIAGAAPALGVTPIDLLDDLDIPDLG